MLFIPLFSLFISLSLPPLPSAYILPEKKNPPNVTKYESKGT